MHIGEGHATCINLCASAVTVLLLSEIKPLFLPLQGLPDSIAVNAVSWKRIYDSLEPDHAPLPEPWRSDLNALQKIVTLRMLRPDKVTPALTSFVAEALGRRFVEPKPFAIEPSYNDSSCHTPLIFVLSPGRYGCQSCNFATIIISSAPMRHCCVLL